MRMQLELSKKHSKENRKRNRLWIQDLKSRPCTDCGGYYHYSVMEFDHIGKNKVGSISAMVRDNGSLERIKEEIEKCELVCANCHRLRSFKRQAKTLSL
jgi:cyanophycinase-like exopeptidase